MKCIPTRDPIAVLDHADLLRAELQELHAREKALRVLLRAASARERARAKRPIKSQDPGETAMDPCK